MPAKNCQYPYCDQTGAPEYCETHKAFETVKLLKFKDKSQCVGEFITWLEGEKGYRIAKYVNEDSDRLIGIHDSNESLLAEFFGIDLKKMEKEKQGLLELIRSQK